MRETLSGTVREKQRAELATPLYPWVKTENYQSLEMSVYNVDMF